MQNIVLFGPPGAGKGTQSEKMISEFGLTHLSTGDILRGEIKAGTALGLEAKKLMDQGELVPDEVVIGMIDNKVAEHKEGNGFIFDGFPRTVAQAEALDSMLESHGLSITKMLALNVPDEELKTRLLLRGKDSGRADDQSEEKINNRISVYKAQTLPVADYYTAQGKFNKIDGMGSIEEIFQRIVAELTA